MRRFFLRNGREGKKKKILRNHVRIAFDWIFCSIASHMNKSKTKWELTKRNFLSQFKYILLLGLTRTFSTKIWEGSWESTKLNSIFIHYLHPDPFLFSFSVFASSSLSQNNRDNCKKMMLVHRHHFENNDFMSCSCFYLESQLHVSPYVQKYANVSKTLRKTHLQKTSRKALRRKIRKCECGLIVRLRKVYFSFNPLTPRVNKRP